MVSLSIRLAISSFALRERRMRSRLISAVAISSLLLVVVAIRDTATLHILREPLCLGLLVMLLLDPTSMLVGDISLLPLGNQAPYSWLLLRLHHRPLPREALFPLLVDPSRRSIVFGAMSWGTLLVTALPGRMVRGEEEEMAEAEVGVIEAELSWRQEQYKEDYKVLFHMMVCLVRHCLILVLRTLLYLVHTV